MLTIDTRDPEQIEHGIALLETALELQSADGDELTPEAGSSGQGGNTADAQKMISTLWSRFGAKNRSYLRAAAKLAKTQGTFTLDDLAAAVGDDRAKVA